MNTTMCNNFNGSDDHELSETELDELTTTRFVFEDSGLEAARFSQSPVSHCTSPIECMGGDDVLLDDYCYLEKSSQNLNSDGATELLNRILAAKHEELMSYDLWRVYESSVLWKNTSRTTELALIKSTLSWVDCRPIHLHVFCRRLIESDIFELIKEALEVAPPKKYRSLHRTTIKTEMPLRQFLGNLKTIASNLQDINLKEWHQLAAQNQAPKKLKTKNIGNFAELEHILCNTGMSAATKLWMGTHGKPHIELNIEFLSVIDGNGRRSKTIVIEQLVTPAPGTVPGKRVTFGTPEVAQVHEFEIGDNAPFHSFSLSNNKAADLISHLESQQFKYVTLR